VLQSEGLEVIRTSRLKTSGAREDERAGGELGVVHGGSLGAKPCNSGWLYEKL